MLAYEYTDGEIEELEIDQPHMGIWCVIEWIPGAGRMREINENIRPTGQPHGQTTTSMPTLSLKLT